jgi:hypothetical protein
MCHVSLSPYTRDVTRRDAMIHVITFCFCYVSLFHLLYPREFPFHYISNDAISPLRDMIFTRISYNLYFLYPISNHHALYIKTSQAGSNGMLVLPWLNAVLFILKDFHRMCVSRNRRGSLEIRTRKHMYSIERCVSFHRNSDSRPAM